MNCGATYGAISLNNVIYSTLYKEIYTILLVRLRAPLFPYNTNSYNAINFVDFVWFLRGYHGAIPDPIWLINSSIQHTKTQCFRKCSQLNPPDSASILFNTALLI